MSAPDTELSSLAQRIAEVLARPDVRALDAESLAERVRELTPSDLGALHAVLLAGWDASPASDHRWSPLPTAVRDRLPEATYSVVDAVRTLAAVAQEGATDREPVPARMACTATQVIAACEDPSSGAVHAAARDVLARLRDIAAAGSVDADHPHRASEGFPWDQPLEVATLGALPGAQAVWPDLHAQLHADADSRWEASYRQLLSRSRWQELLLLRRAPELWDDHLDLSQARAAIGPDDIPVYRTWVREVLREALEHARDVQEGRVAYRADGAFASHESTAVVHAAFQALLWDEPWVGALMAELLPAVAIAPDPAVRSAPSQSMAMGLGRAVAAAPTPETIEVLQATIPDIRHRSVVKKLRQHVAKAGKTLATRPEHVLRAASDGRIGAKQRTTLTRALQAGYLADVTWELEEWLGHVRRQPDLADLLGRLVWRVTAPGGQGSTAARFAAGADDGEPVWTDADGEVVEVDPASSIALWHPIEADADEREAWRRHVWSVRLEQPFRQVFREHFDPSFDRPGVLTDFAGFVVDSRVLLGVARADGWSIETLDPWLVRRIGGFWARIEFRYRVYPGATQANEVGAVVVSEDRAGQRDWRPGDDRAGRIQLSELLRSVDLMVSVSALGLADGQEEGRSDAIERGPSWMDGTALRREVVARAVADLPDATVDRTHLRIGGYAIHLRTARITEHGQEVALEVPERPTLAVPWLPYDEKLLARILAAAAQCADATTDGHAPG